MEKYIFIENSIENEYRYIFLCGTKFDAKNEADKRIVLRDFLKKENILYRPIILEDNFVFVKNRKKFLAYDDIHMKNLYQVEMLTNYLVDNNIIIHESISTGAEAGLFLSEQQSLTKTCLLLPDEMAVEENKLGQFLSLAFLRTDPKLKVITYFPRLKSNIVSDNVKNWHTYFYNDQIGKNLGNEIKQFIKGGLVLDKIKFVKSKTKVCEGCIHYLIRDSKLEITAIPRIIMMCIACLFNIEDVQKEMFDSDGKKLGEFINILKKWLQLVLINTIEEKTGTEICECSIKAEMNVKGVYISNIIGLSLYLFQAAGFIDIIKQKDYQKTGKLSIKRKMVTDKDNKKHFFYEKYSKCINTIVDIQII